VSIAARGTSAPQRVPWCKKLRMATLCVASNNLFHLGS